MRATVLMLAVAALMFSAAEIAGASDKWTRIGFSAGGVPTPDAATITRPSLGHQSYQDMTKPPPIGVDEEMRIGDRLFPKVKFGPVRGSLVHVFWEVGSAWMNIATLPEPVQIRLGFVPTKQAAEPQASGGAGATNFHSRASGAGAAVAPVPWQTFLGKVIAVLKDGLIVNAMNTATLNEADIFLSGFPGLNDAVEGDELKFFANRAGRYNYVTADGTSRMLARWVFVTLGPPKH